MTSLDISRLFGVKGYVAVVTGGSSGLGFMICKGLVVNGAKVYLVALPSEPIDDKVAELCELGNTTGGGSASLTIESRYACDVSSKEAIAELVKFVSQCESHLDILVSNAGIRRDPVTPCDVTSASLAELQASMWSHRHSDWADTFSVNTAAHYFLSVAFMPLLAAAAQRDLGAGSKAAAKAEAWWL
ncbi:glutamyl-tRNA amidotransferase subunit [Colletotrichum tofieldiae]|nr:glutamyl-tRNA amidotransferase subunit [Colletotrichum tofieldiae]